MIKLRLKLAYLLCPELASDRRDLLRLMETDPLTKLGNRVALDRALSSKEENLGIVISDINNLGLYNKVKGHKAGDWCIRGAAYALRYAGSQTPNCRSFRFGGDEFVSLVPLEDIEAFKKLAQACYLEKEVSKGCWVSLTTSSGTTFAQADRGLQALKRERKASDLYIPSMEDALC